ncbi:hypothetical protein P43SY_010099 [Pythium insidiosum]|uniref:Zinc (Zn2)-Iron (Fe2) Permease (ZIP) Family n=1 Tax=Pythium insidiosum TaxID=114742 RepID=A0AAD5M695_PYTIN|nr:hypothetical protein P43SY_010099 [Pythium insidiosum]
MTRKLATALLLCATIALFAGSSLGQDAECSGHGKRHGNHCHCERGYKNKGLECLPIDGGAASCPAGGINWVASSLLYLERGAYAIELTNNTEHMATMLLPLENVTDASLDVLDKSIERATSLVEDLALPRKLVKPGQVVAPSADVLYIIQRNNAEELQRLKEECEKTPGNVWHIDHCDGPDGHGRRRRLAAASVMTVNLTVTETAFYALHLQHNAAKEFAMRIVSTRSGAAVSSRVEKLSGENEGDHDHAHAHSPRKASWKVWLKTMAAVGVVTMLAVIGLALLMIRESMLQRLMDALVALSAGALFGAAFIHILPESIEFFDPYGQMNLTLSMIFTAGFVGAMVIEMFLEVLVARVGGEHNHHGHAHGRISPRASALKLLSPAAQATPAADQGFTELETSGASARPSMTTNKPAPSKWSLTVDWARIKPMAYIILLGDLFHNFVDGILIATAFLACDDALGISVTLSAILHEVPQEFCDFIILIDAGFTSFQAIFFNFLSALSAFLGAAIILSAVEVTKEAMGLLLGFGAGTLTYIAATDLLPRALRVTNFRDFFLHLTLFGVGIGCLALTTLHHVHCEIE